MKHITPVAFLLMVVTVLGCKSSDNDVRKEVFYDASIKVDANNVPLSSTQFYFPLIEREDSVPKSAKEDSAISSDKGYKDPFHIDSFHNKWYSEHLFRMKEPLLFNKPCDSEIVRVTWLRTFHNPIVITLEKKEDKYTLHWKRCDGKGGYDPGKMIEDKSKEVDINNWKELNKTLRQVNFWNKGSIYEPLMCDGARSIVEAAGPDYYWLQSRQGISPVVKYLLTLTDMWIPKKDIY